MYSGKRAYSLVVAHQSDRREGKGDSIPLPSNLTRERGKVGQQPRAKESTKIPEAYGAIVVNVDCRDDYGVTVDWVDFLPLIIL